MRDAKGRLRHVYSHATGVKAFFFRFFLADKGDTSIQTEVAILPQYRLHPPLSEVNTPDCRTDATCGAWFAPLTAYMRVSVTGSSTLLGLRCMVAARFTTFNRVKIDGFASRRSSPCLTERKLTDSQVEEGCRGVYRSCCDSMHPPGATLPIIVIIGIVVDIDKPSDSNGFTVKSNVSRHRSSCRGTI